MNNQLAIATMIHDRIGTRLKGIFGDDPTADPSKLFSLDVTPGKLLNQLEKIDGEQADEAPNVGLAIVDIIGFTVKDLQDLPADPLHVFDRLSPFLKEKSNALRELFTTSDSNSIRRAWDQLSGRLHELRSFLGTDIAAILPLATIDSATPEDKLDNLVENTKKALLQYFFKRTGYETVDGANIVAPVNLSDIPGLITDPVKRKNAFSPATGEHYLRDTIRVTLEASYDSVRILGNRAQIIKDLLRGRQSTANGKDTVEKKFISWLRGFSSMAESASMRGVEIAAQGISEFQTSPLLAAAAGSFAGTVARKIAQESFLTLLRKELPQV